jgi:hypothetical protein
MEFNACDGCVAAVLYMRDHHVESCHPAAVEETTKPFA